MKRAFNDWSHGLLPIFAQELLREAATVGEAGSVARRRAVEHAIAQVQRRYSQFFKPGVDAGGYVGDLDFAIPQFISTKE